MSLKDKLQESILQVPELIKSIKEKFELDDPKEDQDSTVVTEQSFVDVKLTDGSIIRYESEEPGSPVNVLQEDGTLLPAPDGEHQAEDGTIIVTADGLLQEIKVAEMPEGEAPDVELDKDQSSLTPAKAKKIIESIVKEHVFAIDEKIKELKEESAKVEELKAQTSEAFKALEDKIANIEQFNKEHFELTERIAGEPSAKSTVSKKDGFKVAKEDSNDKKETKKGLSMQDWQEQYMNY